MTDLAEIKRLREYCDWILRPGPNAASPTAPAAVIARALLALLSTGQNGEMPIREHEHPGFGLSTSPNAVSLPGVRALIKNCLCVTNVIGPLYGIGWNAAIDFILSRIDAAPSLSTGQQEVGREEVVPIIKEHVRIDDDSEEWESPQPRIVGVDKAADALLSAYHMQRRA